MQSKENLPQVGQMDPAKRNSPIVDEPPAAESDTERVNCLFNGQEFTPGAQVCSGTVRLKCYINGTWGKVGNCPPA